MKTYYRSPDIEALVMRTIICLTPAMDSMNEKNPTYTQGISSSDINSTLIITHQNARCFHIEFNTNAPGSHTTQLPEKYPDLKSYYDQGKPKNLNKYYTLKIDLDLDALDETSARFSGCGRNKACLMQRLSELVEETQYLTDGEDHIYSDVPTNIDLLAAAAYQTIAEIEAKAEALKETPKQTSDVYQLTA